MNVARTQRPHGPTVFVTQVSKLIAPAHSLIFSHGQSHVDPAVYLSFRRLRAHCKDGRDAATSAGSAITQSHLRTLCHALHNGAAGTLSCDPLLQLAARCISEAHIHSRSYGSERWPSDMNGAEHGRRGTRYIADSGVARVCAVHHTRVRLPVSLFPPARIHVLTQTRPQSYASARVARWFPPRFVKTAAGAVYWNTEGGSEVVVRT